MSPLTPGVPRTVCFSIQQTGGPSLSPLDQTASGTRLTISPAEGLEVGLERRRINRHGTDLGGVAAGYLSPEPMLVRPKFAAAKARLGQAVPSYAYAANNPVRYVDRNGLWIVYDMDDEDLMRQRRWKFPPMSRNRSAAAR